MPQHPHDDCEKIVGTTVLGHVCNSSFHAQAISSIRQVLRHHRSRADQPAPPQVLLPSRRVAFSRTAMSPYKAAKTAGFQRFTPDSHWMGYHTERPQSDEPKEAEGHPLGTNDIWIEKEVRAAAG